jgi:2',3'-cyclic-nucleotide 2'-phosphodiesterase (5'-nucleotidase family)
MMHNSVAKIVSSRWLLLLLLLISAPLALAQQPAPQTSPTAQTPAARDVHARVTQTPVDASIKDDPAVDQMLAVYGPKVRALDVVIGKLKGELRKGGYGAGSLGNFVADGMRAQASVKLGKPVDLAIMNGGGLRRNTISEGELRARDIFELLPFENALVTLDLTGEQVLKILGVVVTNREAQSGARITYIIKADKSAALERATVGNKEIDPKATYTVVTIDYIVNVGGDRYAVLREGKNLRPLGITLRDAMMDYVKAKAAAGRDIKPNLDGRFNLDRANSVLTGEAPPKAGQNRPHPPPQAGSPLGVVDAGGLNWLPY